MELRKLMPATALVVTGTFLAAGCGGTLEEKYRRGEITSTTTTTTSRGPAPDTTPTTGATTTTTTTAPTPGNAAGQRAQGEARGLEAGGTIVGSAAWRHVVLPLGGRHR